MDRACARLALVAALCSTACESKTSSTPTPVVDMAGAPSADLSSSSSSGDLATTQPDLSTVTSAPDLLPPPIVSLSSTDVVGSPTADLLFVTNVSNPPNAYVAGGKSGTLILSSDGNNWQAFATMGKPANAIATLAYSDTQTTYVLSGTDGVFYQASAAAGWVKATVPNNSIFAKVIWAPAPLSKFIGVGTNGILLSSNGLTWANPTSSTAVGLNDVYRVSSTLFVAVGAGGAAFTSVDGNTWVDQTANTLSSNALEGVTSNGTRLIAVGNANPPDILYSDDSGASWSHATRPTTAQALSAVTWTGRVFVAVGAGGTVLASTDGITWQNGIGPTGVQLSSVNAGGSVLVAVGAAGTIVVGAK
jgi:photosystem II stability/assembly factor-like uncharacterized protein